VATGHTADDQAETVLHRLLRGTGLQGLRGIAPRRELETGVEVVRPLLRATRADVLAYLAALGQTYRHDSSNDSLDRTRNRIRHELLPHLVQGYNPAVVALLGRLAEQADEAWREERDAAAELLRHAELPRAGALLIFDRAALAAAPRRLVRAMLRMAWEREGWPVGGMGYEDWQRLADLVQEETGAVDLPGRVRARCRGRVLQLGRGPSE
jgi:tRNA(Ile)-lysidine synthase